MRLKWISISSLLIVVTLVVTACAGAAPGVVQDSSPAAVEEPAQSETVKEAETEKEEMAEAAHEAPMLAEMVAAGQLPPLDERLPANPKVVEPHEQIGQYGGTWHLGLRGGNDAALIYRTVGYDQLTRWDLAWNTVEPNIAESIDVNDDATEFTFHLREGMKWSDGMPFTTDDFMWWYEHVFLNEDIMPSPPSFLTTVVDGEKVPAVFEKVDDYTLKISFASPNGMFLAQLAAPNGRQLSVPRAAHWLQQFHPDFNPNVDELVEKDAFPDWVALMQDRIGDDALFQHPEVPTLSPWVIVKAYGANPDIVEAVRNPYYWKVDPEGNQLPYIDRVRYDVGESVDVLVLKALNGEIDNQGRHIATNDNKAVFADNREAGNYRIIEQLGTGSNFMVLNLNQTHKDPVKRELFQNKDFRIALSHAINRQEIIDAILIGEGEPHQPSPLPSSPFYNERLAKQYTEYDPDLANQMLDDLGLTARDEDGFRLGPDGEPFIINVEVITVATSSADALELVKKDWEAVGIRMEIKIEDRTLYFERHSANEHDASVWGGEGGLGWDVYLAPKNVIPMHNNGSRYALPWAYWFNNPNAENAEEPPESVKAQMEIYQQVLTIASDTEREALMKEVLEMAADQFYLLGISTPASGYRITSNEMGNVPVMIGSWTWPTPGPSNPEQYFFRQ